MVSFFDISLKAENLNINNSIIVASSDIVLNYTKPFIKNICLASYRLCVNNSCYFTSREPIKIANNKEDDLKAIVSLNLLTVLKELKEKVRQAVNYEHLQEIRSMDQSLRDRTSLCQQQMVPYNQKIEQLYEKRKTKLYPHEKRDLKLLKSKISDLETQIEEDTLNCAKEKELILTRLERRKISSYKGVIKDESNQ